MHTQHMNMTYLLLHLYPYTDIDTHTHIYILYTYRAYIALLHTWHIFFLREQLLAGEKLALQAFHRAVYPASLARCRLEGGRS